MVRAWSESGVLVTGAASGIGLAFSKAMAKRGATVWMTDIDAPGVEKAARDIGAKTRSAALDVRDADAVRRMVERVAGEHGRIDCLFNNAGGPAPVGGIEGIPVEGFDAAMAVLVRSVMLGMKHVAPVMLKSTTSTPGPPVMSKTTLDSPLIDRLSWTRVSTLFGPGPKTMTGLSFRWPLLPPKVNRIVSLPFRSMVYCVHSVVRMIG